MRTSEALIVGGYTEPLYRLASAGTHRHSREGRALTRAIQASGLRKHYGAVGATNSIGTDHSHTDRILGPRSRHGGPVRTLDVAINPLRDRQMLYSVDTCRAAPIETQGRPILVIGP